MFAIAKLTFDTSQMWVCMGNSNMYACAHALCLSLLRRVMFGGLGQLCDGVLGGNDFMESKELRVLPGYDYIGWNRETLGQPTVDIEFHFEKTRVFHTMQVSMCSSSLDT